jgi:hypothetical protein
MKIIVLGCLLLFFNPMFAQRILISEFHYDHVSVDSNEFIEIMAPSQNDVSCYWLFMVNGGAGLPEVYKRVALNDFSVLKGDFQDLYLFYNGKKDQIQNGPKDGFLLYDSCHRKVVQYLSYEGILLALPGYTSAASQDVGVAESAEPDSSSLSLRGDLAGPEPLFWVKGPSSKHKLNTLLEISRHQRCKLSGSVFSAQQQCVGHDNIKASVTLVRQDIEDPSIESNNTFFSVALDPQGGYQIWAEPDNYLLYLNLPEGYEALGENPTPIVLSTTTGYKHDFCIENIVTGIQSNAFEAMQVLIKDQVVSINGFNGFCKVVLCTMQGQQEVYETSEFKTSLAGMVLLKIFTNKGCYFKKLWLE